jgi:hypothetical protein
MKWIGQHIYDLESKFRNTIEISGGDSSITTIDYDANDISTWRLVAKTFDVDDYETSPEALFFKPDGTKMYLIGRSGDDVDEFALSTPWDVTTASYTDQLAGIGSSPTSESNPYGMFFSPDGIYLYIVGSSVDQVAQFTLSTAWDVSTGSYTREQDLLKSDGSDYINPTGIFFKPDGTEFWVTSVTEDTIQKYTLSTAWDVSTISVSHSTSLLNFFTATNLYDPISHNTDDIGSVADIFFSDDGSRVWLVDSGGDTVYQLDLSTPWDVTTKTYSGGNVMTTPYATNAGGLFVSESANKAFIVANSNDMVRTFNFGAATFDTSNDSSVGFKSGLNVKGDSTFDGISSFRNVYAAYLYSRGSLYNLGTTSLTQGNGGTVNILDGTTYTNTARLDVMTNIYWGANNIDQSIQDNYQHNINLGRPRTGSTVNLNIGRSRTGGGVSTDHTGIVKIVSKAQTFDHDGYLKVGQKLEVTGNADLEPFDLGGTVIFNDTFTETNTTALESHTPDTGAGWTKVFDDGATNTWNVIGGGGYASLNASDSDDGVIYLADTLPTSVDYEVRVDFKRRDSGDDTFEIIFKYKDANNFYYLQWSTNYSTYCRLRKVEGGVGSDIEGNFNYGVMNSTSDNLATALKVRFIDNKIMIWDIDSNDFKAYRGSFPVTTDFSDGAGGTYHKVGMGLGDLEGGTLDSTSTWKIDKFELKMLSSAATLAASTKHYIENGNIGIGTTNPSEKLHVVGDARIQGDLTVNGTYTQIDTDVTTTEQWLVTNDGTGPAAIINQKGSEDIFDVQDDGTSVFYIEDGGNIGIGTTSPSVLLHISSDSSTNFRMSRTGTGQIWEQTIDSSARWILREAASEGGTKYARLTIDDAGDTWLCENGGNVGIGTTSPTYKLDVDGEILSDGLRLNLSATTQRAITSTGTDSIQIGDASVNELKFKNTAGTSMIIAASGKVGIGTTSPLANLHVESKILISQDLGDKPKLAFSENVSNDDEFIIEYQGDGAGSGNYVSFYSDISGWSDLGEGFNYIPENGRVGIGTTSPAAVLHVYGTTGIVSESPSNANVTIRRNDNTNYSALLKYHTGNSEKWVAGLSDAGDFTGSTGVEYFIGTAKTAPKFLINSSGNIGIGTVSPLGLFQLDEYTVAAQGSNTSYGVASIFADSGAPALYIGVKDAAYPNRGYGFKATTSGVNADFTIYEKGLNGDRFTIKTGGNVGIGTTAPASLLHVAGTVQGETIKAHHADGNGVSLHIGRVDNSNYWNVNHAGNDFRLYNTAASGSDILLGVDASGNVEANNVGIGTASPSEKLHVVGNLNLDGDADVSGDLTVTGVTYGAYHSVVEDQYYFDDYNGKRNLSFFYKNARADLIRYQAVDNYEYWDGSDWVADASQETNVEKLLDGRQDTKWNVPSRDYKFRFTTKQTSGWPTTAMIWMQTSWSGSTYPGATMLVEEYDGSSWATKVTAEFTSDNGNTNWGLHSRADSALHTGDGDGANETRITIDFYGWSPNNGSYTTIPLQNLMITSNYAGTENTDYTNLLNYDRDATFAGKVISGGDIDLPSGASLDWANGDARIVEGETNNYSLTFKTYDGSSCSAALRLDGDNTATFSGPLTVGVDDTGHDVKFYGATSGRYMLWDESSDLLLHRDNVKSTFGNASDLQIFHDASNSYIYHGGTGNLYIKNETNDQDVVLQCDDGSGGITAYLTLDGGAGYTTAQKDIRMADGVSFRVGDGGDARFMHNGSDMYLENFTGDLIIRNSLDDKDILFQCDDGSGGTTTYLALDGTNERILVSKHINLIDSVILQIGNSQDLRLYHNGSHSYIAQEGTGNLYIYTATDDGDIIFQSDDGSGGVETYFYLDGSASSGEPYTIWPDSSIASWGDGSDFRIKHDGSNAYLYNTTGDIKIINYADDKDIVFQSDDGSGGVETYLTIDGSNSRVQFDANLYVLDGVQLRLGSGNDLRLYHSTNSYISNEGSGDLYIRNLVNDKSIIFQNDDGSGGTTAYLTLDGSDENIKFYKDITVDGGGITIDTDAPGSSLTWKESDSGQTAGQLRSYVNRGDIYLYADGTKTTELSASTDSFIPALHIGGSTAASGGVLQTTGNVNIDGNVDISGAVTLGTPLATDQQKHLAWFEIAGFGTGDGTNYEISVNLDNDTAPFSHNVSTGANGTTAITVQNIMRSGGTVIPQAGTIKRWKGWTTTAGSSTANVALFKITPARNDNSDVAPVLIDNVSYTAVGNAKMLDFEETSFTDASVAAGDIVVTGIKCEDTKTTYFSSTLEIEF